MSYNLYHTKLPLGKKITQYRMFAMTMKKKFIRTTYFLQSLLQKTAAFKRITHYRMFAMTVKINSTNDLCFTV